MHPLIPPHRPACGRVAEPRTHRIAGLPWTATPSGSWPGAQHRPCDILRLHSPTRPPRWGWEFVRVSFLQRCRAYGARGRSNANGVASLSPGLRGTSYPGLRPQILEKGSVPTIDTRLVWFSRVITPRFPFQYSSVICSPPWAGLGISFWPLLSTTKSSTSSGTCPSRLGTFSGTSITSKTSLRPISSNCTAAYL